MKVIITESQYLLLNEQLGGLPRMDTRNDPSINDIYQIIKDNPGTSQVVASVLVGLMTGGSTLVVQALAQMAVQIPFVIEDLKKGNNVGAAIGVLISALPLASRVFKIGLGANFKALENLGKKEVLDKLFKAKTSEQVANVIKSSFPDGEVEEAFLNRLLRQTPGELKKIIKTGIDQSLKDGIENGTIKLAKIPFKEQIWWKQMGFELPTASTLSGGNYVYQNSKDFNMMDISNTVLNNVEKMKKIQETNPADVTVKILPVLKKYSDIYDTETSTQDHLDKLEKIQSIVLDTYLKNPNADLNKVAENADKNI